jgi:hypothetical protein
MNSDNTQQRLTFGLAVFVFGFVKIKVKRSQPSAAPTGEHIPM